MGFKDDKEQTMTLYLELDFNNRQGSWRPQNAHRPETWAGDISDRQFSKKGADRVLSVAGEMPQLHWRKRRSSKDKNKSMYICQVSDYSDPQWQPAARNFDALRMFASMPKL